MPLTDLKIKNAKSGAKPYKLSDGKGLYLWVTPNGSKLWRMDYRVMGTGKTLSIGKYPLISLSDAREVRFNAKKLLVEGIDPAAKKQDDKRTAAYAADNTFKSVAEDWHSRNKKKWSPDHASRLIRRLELYAFPTIGTRSVNSIRTPELVQLIRKQESAGILDTAHRLAQILNVVFRFANQCGLIEQNPASDLRGVVTPHETVNFPSIKAAELPEFLQKLEQVEASPQNKIAVKLLMLSFLRPSELRKSLWTDINFKEKKWLIPAERMKMRKSHMVPLAKQAIALLRELEKLTGKGQYLFPSAHHRKHPYMSENTINAVLNRMGYKSRMVGHGLKISGFECLQSG
jgi:integrase